MTIRHLAFRFDGERYASLVVARCCRGGAVDPAELRSWAKAASRSVSGDSDLILRALRFETEWLDPDLPFGVLRLLETVAAEFVGRRVPSLSPESFAAYYVLGEALPLLGWRAQEVRRLVYGDSLAEVQGLDLGRDFRHDRPSAGVLSMVSAGEMSRRLREDRNRCAAPPADVESALGGYSETRSLSVPDLLSGAIEAAISMVDAVVEGKTDLFVVFDD